MTERGEQMKRDAMTFYDLMFNQCRPAEAIQRYAGAHYIQHNPHVADGRQAFIDYFERMAKEYPGKHVEFKRALVDENAGIVILHCHQTWPGDEEYAGIDLFRFDTDGKIVEHWDVLQLIPATSANDNGMFLRQPRVPLKRRRNEASETVMAASLLMRMLDFRYMCSRARWDSDHRSRAQRDAGAEPPDADG